MYDLCYNEVKGSVEMKQRIEKLRTTMRQYGLESLLITSPYNLRYLTNFTGTTGLAVITLERLYFVTDSRYTEQAEKQAEDFIIVQNIGPIYEEVTKILEQDEPENIGFEENITYAEYVALEEIVPLTTDLVPVSGMVEALREVKSADEVAIIKQACAISDQAFTHILDYIKPGMTEIQVANELDFYMRSLGASGVSFETIVASGARSAMPHGVASEKIIEQGDLVTLDFGCYYHGYVSDMTRTIAVGEPDEKLKEIYQIVLEAQEKVLEVAKAGLSGAEYDRIARDYIVEKGYGAYFSHGIGHGIGLEIHEEPTISQRLDNILYAGQVITDEPGIYLSGLGGVRIEDDLLITEEGCEVLTHAPKELIIV